MLLSVTVRCSGCALFVLLKGNELIAERPLCAQIEQVRWLLLESPFLMLAKVHMYTHVLVIKTVTRLNFAEEVTSSFQLGCRLSGDCFEHLRFYSITALLLMSLAADSSRRTL